MGYQIIPQPVAEGDEPLYAIWSTYSDQIIFWDATEKEVHGFFLEQTVEDFERNHAALMRAVKENNGRAYAQFTKTWYQALAEHEGRHGPLEGIEV